MSVYPLRGNLMRKHKRNWAYKVRTIGIFIGIFVLQNRWKFSPVVITAIVFSPQILKDIDSFRVPLDLEELFQVLVGILKT